MGVVVCGWCAGGVRVVCRWCVGGVPGPPYIPDAAGKTVEHKAGGEIVRQPGGRW